MTLMSFLISGGFFILGVVSVAIFLGAIVHYCDRYDSWAESKGWIRRHRYEYVFPGLACVFIVLLFCVCLNNL